MKPSLRGHILLASPSLRDPNFVRCVVLMVKHDRDGAIGLIINSPMELTVAQACDGQLEGAEHIDAPLYRGGPCPGPMMVLAGRPCGEAGEVLPGVNFTTDKGDIDQFIRDDVRPIRYLLGYAGWAADQLEQELAEGSWAVLPATPQDVFGSDRDLWPRLMARANLMKFIGPDQIPDDPSSN